MPSRYDAIVIGSGPNGLAAAIELAQAGQEVLLIEAKGTPGGGMRTLELTLPGFQHDVCSTVHPLGIASPFFRKLNLAPHGLDWVHPEIPLAHPLDGGRAAGLRQSLDETADGLGEDGSAYRRLLAHFVDNAQALLEEILGPLPLPPRHPLLLARFGWQAVRPAKSLAKSHFNRQETQALFAGLAAHAMLPLEAIASASFGLVLGLLGHAVGWPVARGGSQAIAKALSAHFTRLGGKIETGWEVASLEELPQSRVVLFDLTPRQIVHIAGNALPPGYVNRLQRYRYGMGVFKVDYALSEPVPWTAGICRQAGTVHVGGTLEEVAAAERTAWRGKTPEKPFVLFVQPTRFDPSRAPAGKEIGWAYCHVPSGSPVDMVPYIEGQIERFAPGFRQTILARSVMYPAGMEEYNPNYVGGDINGGVQDWRQLFFRPVVSRNPYATPNPRLFICSSATPPGGGVHGMCGMHAARAALNSTLRKGSREG